MANDNSSKTAQCYLTYNRDDSWIEIESVATGAIVKLDTYPDGKGWHVLSLPEREFVNELLNTGDPNDCEVSLTYDQMRRWKLLCDSFTRANPTTKYATGNAPVTPQQTIVQSATPTPTLKVEAPSKAPVQQLLATPIEAGNGKQVQIVSITPITAEEASTPTISNTVTSSIEHVARRTDHRSHYGAGADYDEQRINALNDAIRQTDEGYYQLDYDIRGDSGIPASPLGRCQMPASEEGGKPWKFRGLRAYSIESSESVRVYTKEAIESEEMQRFVRTLERLGCDPHVWPFAASASEKIKAFLVKKLDAHLRDLHTRLIQNIDAADKRLRDAIAELERLERENLPTTGGKTLDEEQTARDNSIRGHIRKAGNDLDNAIACAERFDATEQVTDLLNGLRQAIRSQAETFNVHARLMGIKTAPMPK